MDQLPNQSGLHLQPAANSLNYMAQSLKVVADFLCQGNQLERAQIIAQFCVKRKISLALELSRWRHKYEDTVSITTLRQQGSYYGNYTQHISHL
jgi:hypothetical protein